MSLTITNFLDQLQARGVTIAAEGGNLRLKGQTGKLTAAEIDWLRNHKPMILRMLEFHHENPPERLTLYAGRRAGGRALSRWPLDGLHWLPESN